MRSPVVGGAACEHRMFQWYQHAEIPTGRIDGADECHRGDQQELLDIRKGDSGCRHQAGSEH
jgi:hypothetical protein